MLILKRIVHTTIWGGPKISALAGVEGDHIGHLYSLYCRDGVSNEILNGPWKGRFLNDMFPLFKNEVEHKSRGKRESWYFIDAPTSGAIINGCTCRDKEEEELMIKQGRFMEMAATLQVKQGDYVFVEPGTLHAITAGSLVFEIEEGSDFTYRFYDYDRTDRDGNKRELHITKARATLDIGLKSMVKRYNGKEIVEKTYSTKLINNTNIYINESSTIECFTLVNGALSADGMDIAQGSTILLWPGEKLDTNQVKLAFVSKTRTEKL